jgi:hypothetical protein
MRSETGVRRRHCRGRVEGDDSRVLPQVKAGVVGLAGLEPAASSLSGMFAGCVQAARALGDQLNGQMAVTVVVRSIP